MSINPLTAARNAAGATQLANEAADDLKALLRATEAVAMKLDSLASGRMHTAADNRPHYGPADPCPTCEALARESEGG